MLAHHQVSQGVVSLPVIMHVIAHRPVHVKLSIPFPLEHALVFKPVPQNARSSRIGRARKGEVDQGDLHSRLRRIEREPGA